MGAPPFDNQTPPALPKDVLGAGTAVLAGIALDREDELLVSLKLVVGQSPFRNMITPGGFRMSVAKSNCGPLGWVTNRTGYRYSGIDPETNRAWPEMPQAFRKLAESVANEAGFANFVPDACLINRYEPGTKLSLHQDKDEHDFTQPIVSVSLGLPATFLFGGLERGARWSASRWCMATWWFGADLPGCVITASHHWERVSILGLAEFGTI
jgi:alkylated DNA repair protein (DNA oxidative demethylase)